MDLFKSILHDIKKSLIDFNTRKYIFQLNFPSIKENPIEISSCIEYDFIKNNEIENYKTFFMNLVNKKQYFCQLDNLSIISGHYVFSKSKNKITNASLQYYPNPGLLKDIEYLDNNEKKVGDKKPISYYLSNYIRIDYNSSSETYRELYHPCSHIHIGFQADYRISVDKFPFFSEFFKFIMFYHYPDYWTNLINRKKATDKLTDINSSKYITNRIKGKNNNFFKSELSDCEKEHYLFEI